MTSEGSELFSRIAAFVFDEGSPDMTFADRLAKDNGWDLFYTLRVQLDGCGHRLRRDSRNIDLRQ
mgnify:CR=1 FL=1